MDPEKLHMPVVVTRPIGSPYSYIHADMTFQHCVPLEEGRGTSFLNSISGSGEKIYTTDQICNMIDFIVDNIL